MRQKNDRPIGRAGLAIEKLRPHRLAESDMSRSVTDSPWRLMVRRNRSAVEQSVTRPSRSEAAPWSLTAEGGHPVEAVGYPRPNELSLQGFGPKAGQGSQW